MALWGNTDYANNEPKYLQTNHPGNTNVYLVSAGRLSNTSIGSNTNHAVAHQGWVKVTPGVGHVAAINVSGVNTALRYANTYLAIAGANTTPANAQIIVTGAGANNVTVQLNATGTGYTAIPTVTATGANNAGLTFTVTPGGRLGRVQAETLVALSTINITDANSGLPYFVGS